MHVMDSADEGAYHGKIAAAYAQEGNLAGQLLCQLDIDAIQCGCRNVRAQG